MKKLKWSRFDNWLTKLFAVVFVLASAWWMAYSVVIHYRLKSTDWEYLPFVVGGLTILFCFGILSQKATGAAAAIVLPFVDRIRLGRGATTSTVVVPAQPAQPATPAAIVKTTVTPIVKTDESGD